MHRLKGHVALTILVACLVACGAGEPLKVSTIQLGRSANADGTVANHTTTFAPGDTVYLAVVTAGSGSGTLGVRWKWGARVLGEPKKQVEAGGATTSFHLQSAAGFPPGDYTAEVFLDGQSVGTRTFRVSAPR